jgi:hypothetical protein
MRGDSIDMMAGDDECLFFRVGHFFHSYKMGVVAGLTMAICRNRMAMVFSF